MGNVVEPEEPVSVQVRRVIARELDCSLEEVIPQARLVDDLGADSLDLVELMMALEDSFDTTIPDEDARQIQSVGQAVDYVRQLQAKKAAEGPADGAGGAAGAES